MDWCVHIASPCDLEGELSLERLASLETSARLRPAVALTVGLAAKRLGPARFTRCAFGAEFCENLLPSPAALEETRRAAAARGLEFTFLTPYVSDSGIAKLKQLFQVLAGRGGGEVVFNDWGVLNVLRRDFPCLTPVQGRLLNKSLRDPRVTGLYSVAQASNGAPAAATASLQSSNLDCRSYTEFLSRLGVATVELDNLPQGMDLSFSERGVQVAVYLPFGFVSSARVCMAASLHYRPPDKFQPGAPCRHECQTHLVEYTYTNSPFSNRDQKFYLKGNTYFYVHTEAMLGSLFEQAASGRVSRLVLQPRLPMMQ